MAATYTFDVFSSLDGYGSYNSSGDWGEQGPGFLDRRPDLEALAVDRGWGLWLYGTRVPVCA